MFLWLLAVNLFAIIYSHRSSQMFFFCCQTHKLLESQYLTCETGTNLFRVEDTGQLTCCVFVSYWTSTITKRSDRSTVLSVIFDCKPS